jgi:hypothetical protein
MTTTAGTPLSAKPVTTRRLWVVRVGMLALVLGLLLGAWTGPPMALLVLAIAFLGILLGLFSKEPRRAVAWMKGASLAMLAVAVMGLLIGLSERGLRSPTVANQASAVGSLWTINHAEITYAETYKAGFSPSLAALGPPSPGNSPSAAAAGLIDRVLSSGTKSGYTFTYKPGSPDKTGHIKTYTLVARPVNGAGTNSYFSDESGVICQTSEDRPATAKDWPIE